MATLVRLSELAERARRCLLAEDGEERLVLDGPPGLVLIRGVRPTRLEATLYKPAVCLILQGAKETMIGGRSVRFGAGDSLITSHELPVVARITRAPYLALVMALDLSLLRSLYAQVGDAMNEGEEPRALNAHQSSPELVDAFVRYLDLAGDPVEASVMAPLIRKELHYRLLMAPHGAMLRKLSRHDSEASNIARAIGRIRRDFRLRLSVAEVAREIGMSPSTFHKHFKAVTATTPLQYQKHLRLLEARRLIAVEGCSVSSAAFEVGYESPTQFSREYSRTFGEPPSKHRAVEEPATN